MVNPEKLPVKPYGRDPALEQYIRRLEGHVKLMKADPFFNRNDVEEIREEMSEQARVD